MGDTEVAEATTERDTADGWKTVCIRNEKFDVAVIGRMSNNEFLISPVSFHGHIRRGWARIDPIAVPTTRWVRCRAMSMLLKCDTCDELVCRERCSSTQTLPNGQVRRACLTCVASDSDFEDDACQTNLAAS